MALTIGLFGCGRWGKHILRDLIELGANVHVVCLSSDVTMKEALEKGAITSGTALPESIEFDAFVVATPTATHAAVLIDLARKGKPIFVEKPLTADVESARYLAANFPKQIFVMDKWRYHPAVDRIRQLNVSGHLGRILAIKSERWQWHQPHDDVNALWILLPHDLSMAQHILGFIPPVKQAVSTVFGQPEIGVSALLEETSNGPGVHISIGIASPEYSRRLLVIGSEATVELGGTYNKGLTLRKGRPGSREAEEEEIAIPQSMPLFDELEAFLKYVAEEGEAPMSSLEEGLLVVERIAEIERMVHLNEKADS